MKAWNHFRTITRHRHMVMKECFAVGLYRQGLLHDLSKYGPTEFFVGCKYYQGNRSPNNAEREEKGYSSAWLHHKGRNKHHYEYWIDYSVDPKSPMGGMEMPIPYVVEMIMDRIAASKNYNRDTYQDDFPLKYFNRGRDYQMIHPKTLLLMKEYLTMLANDGEKALFHHLKYQVLPAYRKEKKAKAIAAKKVRKKGVSHDKSSL